MNDSNSYEYKLTAVVLVYNGGIFLENCLDCLVNQTLDDLEILLINDKSTDDSLSVCKRYERDYDNVFVIDKEKNEGLATSANIGIQKARGEYVILVDNDDIIPEYAYERLYNNAKKNNSDIAIGQANLLFGISQYEMDFHENSAWESERIIDDVKEFPQVFHDAFYWNKIMRTEFVRENNIHLPYGMIYADRNYSHTAYTYANRISIIPDCVYMWRQRDNSLSMKRKEISNYINRLDSYELDLDIISENYSEYFKILLRRIIIPINGILYDQEFEELIFTRVRDLIIKYAQKIENIYDNDLNDIYNVIIYLIINNKRRELKIILGLDLLNSNVINRNNKSYWTHNKIIENNIDIPDEIMEIHFLENHFLNIGKVKITDDAILFDEIEIPKNLKIKNAYVIFKGKTFYEKVFKDNIYHFKIDYSETNDTNQVFNAKIPLEEINSFELYDIFFKVDYEERISNEFRLDTTCIKNVINNNDEIKILTTPNGNFVIISEQLQNEFKLSYDESKIKLSTYCGDDLKKNLKVFFMKNSTGERIFLTLNDEHTEFELEWKFFLDINSDYSLYLTTYNDNFNIIKESKLNEKHICDFKNTKFKVNDINVEIYKSSSGDIKLKSI